MRKLIYLIVGLLFIPFIVAVVIVAIPLFILFMLLFKVLFAFRKRKPAQNSPRPSRTVSSDPDVYDIECEVVDDKDSKK